MLNEQEETSCSTCKKSTGAKPRRGLSSVLYWQILGKINSMDDLIANMGKFIQIFRRGSNKEASQVFARELEGKIWGDPGTFTEVKKWLLKQLIFIDYNSGEKALYQHLYNFYAKEGIDEPFTEFYQNYIFHIGEPMTKNFVSRALGAIGLKSKMVRIDFERRKKSAMVLKFSGEEVCEAIRSSEVLRGTDC
jgi:hypothetical protein